MGMTKERLAESLKRGHETGMLQGVFVPTDPSDIEEARLLVRNIWRDRLYEEAVAMQELLEEVLHLRNLCQIQDAQMKRAQRDHAEEKALKAIRQSRTRGHGERPQRS